MAAEEVIQHYIDPASLRRDTDIFLGYLKEVQDEFNKLNSFKANIQAAGNIGDLNKNVTAATDSVSKLSEGIGKVVTASAGFNNTVTQTANAVQQQTTQVNKLSDAYEDLVKASVQNQLASKVLINDRKELNKQLQSGAITEQQFIEGLEKIRKAELTVSAESRDINLALRNLGKEAGAANGSLDQLRAKLNLAQQAFRRLSDEEKRSEIGKGLVTQIQGLTKTITEQEQSVGLFQRNVGNYQSAFDGFGFSIKNVATQLLAAGIALIGFNNIGDFLRGAVDEFNQAEQAASRFKNILDNVGRSDVLPGLTTEATRLANEFKNLDNDDIVNVFQQLVTYGKLTQTQIKQLTPVIIDFAAKSGLSLDEATKTVILGLEGQGRAFKQYGINIKEAGSTTEAFGVIMSELKPKVEGAAKAFGETTAGQIATTRQEINNLKEDIGGGLQPVIKTFYQVISDALKGLQAANKYTIDFIDGIIDKYKLGLGLVRDLLTGDTQGANIRIALNKAQKQSAKELADENQRLNDVQSEAQNIARDASTKPLEEQKKLLADQLTLQTQSFDTYTKIVKAKKESTEEGKKAKADLEKDLVITKALQDVLDNTTIGGGDPNASFKDSAANNEKIRAVNKKFFDDEIKDQITFLKSYSKNDDFYFSDRLDKRKDAFVLEKKLNEESFANEIQNEKDKLNAVLGNKGSSTNARINAQNEYNQRILEINERAGYAEKKLESGLDTDLLQLRADYLKKKADIEREDNNQAHQLFKKQAEDRIAAENAANDIATRNLSGGLDLQVEALDKEYLAKLEKAKGHEKEYTKVIEEYTRERAKIQDDYAKKVLAQQIKTAENQIAIARASGQDTTKLEKTLSDLKIQYADLAVDHEEKVESQAQQERLKRLHEIESGLGKLLEAQNKAFELIGSAIDVGITREKNRLQEQLDNIDKVKKADIDRINATTQSEVDKAAQITIVEARAQAQRDAIEIKQRQADERRARFEKAANIAKIITETAIAVVHQLGSGDVYTALARAIAAGALGAAQLAIAIATPIPKFKSGKGPENRYEGLAVVGDGNKAELVQGKDGSMRVTPSTPTLTYVKSTDIIHPDAAEYLRSRALPIMQQQPSVAKGNDMRKVERKLDVLNSTVKNGQGRVIINNTLNGWSTGYASDHKWVQWRNRNMQS